MNIAEARSRNDGIDFFVNEKNITISAQRLSSGEVQITKLNSIKPFEKIISYKLKILSFLMAFFFTIAFNFIEKNGYGLKLKVILILITIWLTVIFYYFIQTKDPKRIQSFKYHAAEHKALNYWDKYNKPPEKCEDVMEMESISWRCGSTVIAVVLLFITMISIGLIIVPDILTKILWSGLSIYVILYLWGNNKCNFFQKMVIIEPSFEEVEVATLGMIEYLKEKQKT